MYYEFYGFHKQPFPNLPDPGVLYLSPSHKKTLSVLEYATRSRAGFCVVTGEAGTGKTTLVRRLLQEIDADLDVGVVTMSQFETFEELLKWILLAFDQDYASNDRVALFDQFSRYLIDQYQRGHPVTLIIDEAQHLGPAQLEQLRMLSNMNTEKGLLLQTILVGQGELWDTLKRHELRQFAQRISFDTHVEPLENDVVVGEYIRHRLYNAGGDVELFDPETYPFIWLATSGIPRLINLVCDTALVYAYAERADRVDSTMVEAVLNDKTASLAPIAKGGGIGGEREGPNKVVDPQYETQLDALHSQEQPQDSESSGTTHSGSKRSSKKSSKGSSKGSSKDASQEADGGNGQSRFDEARRRYRAVANDD